MRAPSSTARIAWPPAAGGVAAGMTLIELLLAAALAGILLAASWTWLWSIGATATRADAAAQAGSGAAAAVRTIERDVGDAVAVLPPGLGRDAATTMVLRRDALDTAPSEIVIAWDPGRRVLWRNAAESYVSDHVDGFGVSFVVDDGRLVRGGEMHVSDWANVRIVRVDLSVRVGSCTVRRTAEVGLGV